MIIDFSKFNYWGSVVAVFLVMFIVFAIYVGTLVFIKGISITKIIKAFISCVYSSLIIPLILGGLEIVINNNEDISNILLIILILGYINHFYYSSIEVIKIVISRFKEEIKKKNK